MRLPKIFRKRWEVAGNKGSEPVRYWKLSNAYTYAEEMNKWRRMMNDEEFILRRAVYADIA